jgi:hypothetical protein
MKQKKVSYVGLTAGKNQDVKDYIDGMVANIAWI